jgi:broad specificity phosphatase PhoE
MQTCEFVAAALPHVPCTFEASIRERSLGVLEGLTRAEAVEQQPQALALLRSGGSDVKVPGLRQCTD